MSRPEMTRIVHVSIESSCSAANGWVSFSVFICPFLTVGIAYAEEDDAGATKILEAQSRSGDAFPGLRQLSWSVVDDGSDRR